MNTPALDFQHLLHAGLESLRNGQWRQARRQLEQYLSSVDTAKNSQAWTALAIACQWLGESEPKLTALDRALSLNPFDIRALVMKADHFHSLSDRWAAALYYRRAIDSAEPAMLSSPEIQRLLQHAEDKCRIYTTEHERSVLAQLRLVDFDPSTSSRRFVESLDIAMGRRQVFSQRPSRYYFPGLPQLQFYDRQQFSWVPELEAATPGIQAELAQLLQERANFRPYIDDHSHHLPAHRLVDNPDWSAFYLWKNGRLIEENARRCPATVTALLRVPLGFITDKTPSVLFSLLRPGAKIAAHHGMLNTRLICHLPLIVPGGCGLRVGNEAREWHEGRMLIFDDSIEHEAWNNSSELRVVLIFDIWKPELSDEEQRLISALLRTDISPSFAS